MASRRMNATRSRRSWIYDESVPTSKNHYHGEYIGYLAPWGATAAGVPYSGTLFVNSDAYPGKVRLDWAMGGGTIDPDDARPGGYYEGVTRGAYDGGVPHVATTPLRISDTGDFRDTIRWQSTGSNLFNALFEEYLRDDALAKKAEVGFMAYAPPATYSFHYGGSTVAGGSWTDPDGMDWTVRSNMTAYGFPFITFLPADEQAHHALTLHRGARNSWLAAQGVVDESWWVHGYAAGIEPYLYGGQGTFFLDEYSDVFEAA